MAVLTMQSVYMWVMTMMANYYYNGELKDWLIITFFILAFFVGLVLTKISTLPLVPLFKKMKKLEKAEPAVGGVGVVHSKEVTQKYGQVEQKREGGSPAILTARTTEEEPIPRGA